MFIDEIQYSPEAATMLRYFYEQRNDIHVIAACSLLETLINRQISFPVGRVEYLFMYPLNFAEYLQALGESAALDAFKRHPCPDFAHEQLLQLYHQYVLVGGMPEAVATFAETKDILSVNQVYQNLMIAYMDDVEKYAPSKSLVPILRHAIEHAPLEAGGRIKFQGFGHSNYQSREMGEALRLLEKAMLLHLFYPSTAAVAPAERNHKKAPKLHFLDTGMMNYAAGLQQHYFKLTDLHNLYMGRIIENMMAQELLATYPSLQQQLKFWVREKAQSSAEVDFIVPHGQYIIPIEVKAGKAGTLRSLMQFMERTDHPYAVRLYAGKLQYDDLQTMTGKKFKLMNLPYYLVGQLAEYLREFCAK